MSEETLTLMTWLVPAGPLLAFFLITLIFNRHKTWSWVLAWAGIFTSLILGWMIALNIFFEAWGDHFVALMANPLVIADSVAWLPFTRDFSQWLRMGVAVDPLTAVMLFMVPFTTSMIMIYSVGYHSWGLGPGDHVVIGAPVHGGVEPLFSRFFALMSLFGGAMLLLTVADNLLLLFVGWEIMGLCSYMLIGFWYAREYTDTKATPPRRAAVKAFMTTRIADVVMLLGIVYFYRVFGTLNFHDAFSAESLARAAEDPFVGFGGLAIMSLLLFTGTVGKSAQWPLHTWLPDAMEGPTPVSAVIHAAAMVSAGVYMLIRIFPLVATAMSHEPYVGVIIGGIGAFTALMAATIALAQNDVKRVLAYSTISQLGFMVAAVGIGAYVAAAFHLITHAFFKALLFLGSGSIIHGMEVGAEIAHDHHTNPQDMRNMGGLRSKMPITFWTFVIGGFALAGFPFVTAGFWSKDEILADAIYQAGTSSLALVVFIMLAVAAFLTAFYTMRQISLTFLGRPRTELAEHAHEGNAFITVPLIGLAFFAVTFGWLGIPDNFLGTDGIFTNLYHEFVGATIHETFVELNALGIHVHVPEILEWSWAPLLTSMFVALGGLSLGWWLYGREPRETPEAPDLLERPLGAAWGFFANKWYWDELYHVLLVQPVEWFSATFVYQWVDKGLIDGTLHIVARSVYRLGQGMKRFEEVVISDGVDAAKDGFLGMAREFRTIQTGKLQEYVLVSTGIASVLALLVLIINWWPQIRLLLGL